MSPLFWEKSICVVAACNKVAHSFAWERRISKPLYPRADDGPDQLSLSRASFMREEELKHCPHDAVIVTIGQGLNLIRTPGREATLALLMGMAEITDSQQFSSQLMA